MAKKKAIMRKVLTCFIIFAILVSVMPVPVFAMNSSNNATEASNHTNDLEKSFLLPLVSNDTGETVSTLSCDVYVKIDDDTCVGYEVYVDGVYQFTEGQDGTPDGYCAFYVSAGTHKFELRKNGCTTSKSWHCQCGTVYRWVSMPDYWCECGGNGNCDNPPTVKFDKSKYYEGDTVYATASTIHNSVYYEIKDCSGMVRESGYVSNGETISYTVPSGASECCYWEICFYWNERDYPDLGSINAQDVHLHECSRCYTFEVCPKTTCEVYVIIDDDTCIGYEVYVDGVYQFTEGQDGTPDGYCAFYVTAGTHKFELRKNGCTTSKSWYCQCGTVYRWVSMPDYWCEIGDHEETCPSEVKFKGTAKTDELTGLVCYGTYYCDVVIDQILHDPDNSLKVGTVYTVGYGNNPKHIKSGDKIEVNGSFYHSCGPLNQMGRICGDVNKRKECFTQLTTEPSNEMNPSWSPDGSKIAYHISGYPSNIWVMNDDGSNQHALTYSSGQDSNRQPKWSADGTKITFWAFRPFGQGGSIWTMNADGSSQTKIYVKSGYDSYKPTFSPDGSKIVFDLNKRYGGRPHELHKMNPDGTNVVKILNALDDKDDGMGKASGSISYSPNGEWIAFESERSGNWDIWIVKPNGSNLKQLTTDSSMDFYPAWSPDGEKIAFTSDRKGNNDIWILTNVQEVINGKTPNCVQLTKDSNDDKQPSWSPDGNEIVFASDRSGNFDIWVGDISCAGFPTELPDLVITRLWFNKNPCDSGDDVEIIFDVTNQGSGVAKSCMDCLYINGSKVAEFDSGGLAIGSELKPGETRTWYYLYEDVPGTSDPHKIKACTDCQNSVTESDESNNCKEDTLEVEPRCGEITNWETDCTSVQLGGKFGAEMEFDNLMAGGFRFKGIVKVRSPTDEEYPGESRPIFVPSSPNNHGKFAGGNTLYVRIPEGAATGKYDVKLELWNDDTDELCDETEWIENQFRVEEFQEIKFVATAIEYFNASMPGAPFYWTVSVDEIISGPLPCSNQLNVTTYQSFCPPEWGWGYADPNITAGDKVEVYGSYVEDQYGCNVSLFNYECYINHTKSDYYIKKNSGQEEQYIKFQGTAIAKESGAYSMWWVVTVAKVISGPQPSEDTINVVIGGGVMPKGYVDPDIEPGDTVEVYGKYTDGWVSLTQNSHYIKRITESGTRIIEYNISSGAYCPGDLVRASMRYKNNESHQITFRGVFSVRSPTGEIYSDYKTEITPPGREDEFEAGDTLRIRIPEDASTGWYDARLELINDDTEVKYDDTGWIPEQFRIKQCKPPENWSPDIRITNDQADSNNPKLAVDSNNNIHIIWQDNRDGSCGIYYKKLDNHGNTLIDDTKLISLWISCDYLYFYDAPAIAIDSNDNIHIVWIDCVDWTKGVLYREVYYAKFDNNGSIIGDIIRVDNNPERKRSPDIAVDSNNCAHIVWEDYKDDNRLSETYYTKVNDQGGIIISNKRLGHDTVPSGFPKIATDSHNNIHIVWGGSNIRYTKLDNEGNILVESKGLSSRISYFPDIVVDSANDHHVTWVWSDNWLQSHYIYYNKKFNYDKKLISSSGTHPAVAIDSNDHIHIIWIESYDLYDHQICYTKLDNTGNTLVDNTQLTFDPASPSKPDIAVDLNKNIHIVWKDYRDGNGEIYYKTNAGGEKEIKFIGTVIEYNTLIGAAWWNVSVEKLISGPQPCNNNITVFLFAYPPMGYADPNITEGDKVEVYGKYVEDQYGCNVTLNGREEYYIKKVAGPKIIEVDDDFIDDPPNHK